jgi:hypothetical protein
VTRAGYQWTAVGENVAEGPGTAEDVMAGWLASSGHCANIVSPRYSEMDVALVVNDQDDDGVYWTLGLAAPLQGLLLIAADQLIYAEALSYDEQALNLWNP